MVGGPVLPLITNDKFRSVEHRVLAGRIGPRISVACFYNPTTARKFGPLMEFLSDNNPPIYRETHWIKGSGWQLSPCSF
ncbi:1-aminocyclopropane-1-carboxylate oxidase like protein 1 [Quercus suber]|uniref:1-aminocyclopropane-1-carboxylate oxidase like protein 1 n=1 Tax=Quercus suber TaxID=58331 RepID=A0AAW0KYR1_QUESU